jgi:hypothetical protein
MNRTILTTLLDRELHEYRVGRARGDCDAAWRSLERAHILSQSMLGPHIRVHVAMLRLAVDQRDLRELFGQFARLILAPLGSLTGRIPWGNTGRSNVSAFRPMPIPEDLRSIIGERQ